MVNFRSSTPLDRSSTNYTGSDVLSRFPVPNYNFLQPSEQQFMQARINKAVDEREAAYLRERNKRLDLQKKLLMLF